MTKAPFERALVRKGKMALKVARLALNAGDYDSAVSRSYYAMFEFAQAAPLRAGVTEDKLPRTHGGIIDAFRRHAVQSGQIDRELATQLSRTESLRIKADYTGTEDDKVSEPAVAVAEIERERVNLEPISLEEIRRQARENWLQLRQQVVRDAKKGQASPKMPTEAPRRIKAIQLTTILMSSTVLSQSYGSDAICCASVRREIQGGSQRLDFG